jgi:hypothetical protein
VTKSKAVGDGVITEDSQYVVARLAGNFPRHRVKCQLLLSDFKQNLNGLTISVELARINVHSNPLYRSVILQLLLLAYRRKDCFKEALWRSVNASKNINCTYQRVRLQVLTLTNMKCRIGACPRRLYLHSFITGAYSQGYTFGLPFRGFLIRHIQTHGRSPLDEWSARRRDLYLHRTT